MATGGTKISSIQLEDVGSEGPSYFQDALKDIGTVEWTRGQNGKKKPNPLVQRIIEKGGGGSQFDCIDQPWCAWYQNGKLAYKGIPGTNSGMARSFLKWGKPVLEKEARKGDIVVLWRGKKDDGVTGHVGMLVELRRDSFTLLGGNQGDEVCIETYARYRNGKDRILGIRRPRHWTESRKVRAATGAGLTVIADKSLEIVSEPTASVQVASKALKTIDNAQEPLAPFIASRPTLSIVLALITMGLLGYIAWRNFADQKEKGV